MNKREKFEEIMRKYFPPEKYPQLWITIKNGEVV